MKRRWIDLTSVFFKALTGLACLILTLAVVLILGNVVIHGVGHINWDFLSTAPRSGMTEGGIFPAIFGTAFLVILMTIAVVPLGVSTAIYLQEYAPKNPAGCLWCGWPFKTSPAFRPSFSACSGSASSSISSVGVSTNSFSTTSSTSANPPFSGRR
jgi:ABC-type Fe3+ transport system permease subunit